MICTDCGKPVFDTQDLIDGLCPQCVDTLIMPKLSPERDTMGRWNNGKQPSEPSMKSSPGWRSVKR